MSIEAPFLSGLIDRKVWRDVGPAVLGLALPTSVFFTLSYILYQLSYWLSFGMDQFMRILPPLLQLFFLGIGSLTVLLSCTLALVCIFYTYRQEKAPFEAWFSSCLEHKFTLAFCLSSVLVLISLLGIIHAEHILNDDKFKRCVIKVYGRVYRTKMQFLGSCGGIFYFYDGKEPISLLGVPRNQIQYVRFL